MKENGFERKTEELIRKFRNGINQKLLEETIDLCGELLSIVYYIHVDISEYLKKIFKVVIRETNIVERIDFYKRVCKRIDTDEVVNEESINKVLSVLRYSFPVISFIERQVLILAAYAMLYRKAFNNVLCLKFGTDYTLEDFDNIISTEYMSSKDFKQGLIYTPFFYDLFTEDYIWEQFYKDLDTTDKRLLLKSTNCPADILVKSLDDKDVMESYAFIHLCLRSHPNLPAAVKLKFFVE